MRDAKPMTPLGHQPDDLPVHGPEDLGAMAMLTACLIAGGAALVVLAGGYAYHRTTQARIEQLQADIGITAKLGDFHMTEADLHDVAAEAGGGIHCAF